MVFFLVLYGSLTKVLDPFLLFALIYVDLLTAYYCQIGCSFAHKHATHLGKYSLRTSKLWSPTFKFFPDLINLLLHGIHGFIEVLLKPFADLLDLWIEELSGLTLAKPLELFLDFLVLP